MLTLYGLSNCDTVKKASTFLKKHGKEFLFHDFKKSGLSIDKLEEWMLQVSLDKLINKKSTTYRNLSDAQKQDLESPISAVGIVLALPSIIKRPILEDQKIIAIGFKEPEYEVFVKE
jgi:arsenate reductase (glutaredoxin)